MNRALILGGGGVAGIAWELGVLRGLEEAGMPARDWSLVVGTSAGAIVGARILADPDLGRWYAHETRPYARGPRRWSRRWAGAWAGRDGRRPTPAARLGAQRMAPLPHGRVDGPARGPTTSRRLDTGEPDGREIAGRATIG